MDDPLILPEKLDVGGAHTLFEDLSGRRGAAVTLDASRVRKTSALSLEVLLSGARQWDDDGNDFRVVTPSDAFSRACRDLGLDIACLSSTKTGTGEVPK